MIQRFIFKCVNVGNVTYAHVCNMQIVEPMNFPQLPMCWTHVFHVPNYRSSFPAFPWNIFRFEVVKHVSLLLMFHNSVEWCCRLSRQDGLVKVTLGPLVQRGIERFLFTGGQGRKCWTWQFYECSLAWQVPPKHEMYSAYYMANILKFWGENYFSV